MRISYIPYIFLSIFLFSANVLGAPIYLDYQASTPVDPRVLEAKEFGNPHSTTHVYGIRAHKAVEQARNEIVKVINAQPAVSVGSACSSASKELSYVIGELDPEGSLPLQIFR